MKDDEFSLKMFFKGVSTLKQVIWGLGFQRKLDFPVEESVAQYFPLTDGMVEALDNKIRPAVAFTASEIFYDQVSYSSLLLIYVHLYSSILMCGSKSINPIRLSIVYQ